MTCFMCLKNIYKNNNPRDYYSPRESVSTLYRLHMRNVYNFWLIFIFLSLIGVLVTRFSKFRFSHNYRKFSLFEYNS